MARRQVSRMSTEGEAAPAAEAPAEGEPLPEVGVIVIAIVVIFIRVVRMISHLDCRRQAVCPQHAWT